MDTVGKRFGNCGNPDNFRKIVRNPKVSFRSVSKRGQGERPSCDNSENGATTGRTCRLKRKPYPATADGFFLPNLRLIQRGKIMAPMAR